MVVEILGEGVGVARVITEAEFNAATRGDKYYYGRWGYYQKAIHLMQIYNIALDRVLEVGPNKISIFTGGDTLDVNAKVSPTYVHDACVIPWPVKGKYDIVVALQVIEHLTNKPHVFMEMMRIAEAAVISLPYRWKQGHDSHQDIGLDLIRAWTLFVEPVAMMIDNSNGFRRMVLLYRFDDDIRNMARRYAGAW